MKKLLIKKCECGGEVHYLNFENLAECVKCFKSFKKVNDEYKEVSREEFVKLYKEELKKFKQLFTYLLKKYIIKPQLRISNLIFEFYKIKF